MRTSRDVFDFGVFTLDAAEHRLLRGNLPVPLAPKGFDLLLDLVQHAGGLRHKQDLLDAVWPDQFVEEANLAYTVWELRRALGDTAAHPVYIQTIRTRGYRFIARVTRRRSSVARADARRTTHATTLPGTSPARGLGGLRMDVPRVGVRRQPPVFLSALLADQRCHCDRTHAAWDVRWLRKRGRDEFLAREE